MGETIGRVTRRQSRLHAVETDAGPVEADVFVLCLGPGSARFAQSAGFRLPIQPMKGYSLTVPAAAGTAALTRSVTDFDNKIVFAPLNSGGRAVVRVAGIAELIGDDLALDPKRLGLLRQTAEATLSLDWSNGAQPWAGLRPMTPTGRPIIARSPLANLYVNAGHGALGWTLAGGSAQLCAELIDGNESSPLLKHLRWER
jgi:D-amino-acid dehydrogenase